MNIFLNPIYKESLTFSEQPPTLIESEAIVSELFKKIEFRMFQELLPSQHFKTSDAKRIKIHPVDSKTIKIHLLMIASKRPGMELFKRLLASISDSCALKISNKQFVNSINPNIQTIIYDPNETFYYISRNSQGEIILVPYPPEIRLAHECIHALHLYENKKEMFNRGATKPSLPNMTNAEEQLTITGLDNGSLNLRVVDKVCENSLLFAFGYPPRICHFGVKERYTFQDILNYNAVGTIKEILNNNPSFASDYLVNEAKKAGKTQIAELLGKALSK